MPGPKVENELTLSKTVAKLAVEVNERAVEKTKQEMILVGVLNQETEEKLTAIRSAILFGSEKE